MGGKIGAWVDVWRGGGEGGGGRGHLRFRSEGKSLYLVFFFF